MQGALVALLLGVDVADLDGADGCLGALGDVKLGDDVLDVFLDGAHNLRVGCPERYVPGSPTPGAGAG